jgi:hypothetical protein
MYCQDVDEEAQPNPALLLLVFFCRSSTHGYLLPQPDQRSPYLIFATRENSDFILNLKHTAKMLMMKLNQTLRFCHWFFLSEKHS